MKAVELFVGAGGLSLGLSKAGFQHSVMIEKDSAACTTIRENLKSLSFSQTIAPEIFENDAREIKYDCRRNIDLIAGGPPCQPFSAGGNHNGRLDPRDMFPEIIRAIRELRPRSFIIENVKGLLRQSFSEYFNYICLQSTYPELEEQASETWIEHLDRLERHHTSGKILPTENHYNVTYRVLNAADYGVPQKRERVFIVGFRSDLQVEWNFPHPSHSLDALLYDKWVTGSYWKKHNIPKKKIPPEPLKMKKRIERLKHGPAPEEQPWVTLRDAIHDLPCPTNGKKVQHLNHTFYPGAKSYPGHTGSTLDEPAKVLKAGSHGVPGGENMIAFEDGSVRYLTVREAARLQGFPDTYIFPGSWGQSMKQLGNAVPVQLAQIIGSTILKAIAESEPNHHK